MRNAFVAEQDLQYLGAICCGDEDLYPFKCSACEHLMIFCYECDSLHGDLDDLSKVSGRRDCSGCGHVFAKTFMTDDAYRVQVSDWIARGYGHLLQHDGSIESRRAVLVEQLKRNDEHIARLESGAHPFSDHPQFERKFLLPALRYRESLSHQIEFLDRQ